MKPVFNKAQLYLLEVFSHIKTDEELDELVRIVRDHYARKLDEELDKLWKSGQLNEEKMKELRKMHLRTPYKNDKEYSKSCLKIYRSELEVTRKELEEINVDSLSKEEKMRYERKLNEYRTNCCVLEAAFLEGKKEAQVKAGNNSIASHKE